MKRCIVLLLLLSFTLPMRPRAQAQEALQLALNIQKLLQLRKILQNMYDGYQILTNGYNRVSAIAQGNFSIHELFLDGLMQVNPAIRKYRRVADILDYQLKLVKEYKEALRAFRSSGHFSPEELDYLGQVYENLIDRSLTSLDALATVITSSKLRMSDAERIGAIDRIYKDVSDQLGFLRYFNNETRLLGVNRTANAKETEALKKLLEQ
ncbi:MAG: TerB family tellurite resistance protein [Agriterribacter sp.]